MLDFTPGDRVVCKVGYGAVQASDSTNFEKIVFLDILCHCGSGLIALLRNDIFIKSSFIVTEEDCNEFGMSLRFKGATVCIVAEEKVMRIESGTLAGGYSCHRCSEPCPYADTPNRLDKHGDGIYICYLCRSNPYR